MKVLVPFQIELIEIVTVGGQRKHYAERSQGKVQRISIRV